MTKKLVSIFISLILAVSLTILVFGANYPTLVIDEYGVLSEEEAASLLAYCEEISDRHECTVSVIVKNSVPYHIVSWAEDFFDNNGYGYNGTENGVMLVLDMTERDWWITTAGNGLRYVTDAALYQIEDDFLDELHNNGYYAGFHKYAEMVDGYLTLGENGTPYDNDEGNHDPYFGPDSSNYNYYTENSGTRNATPSIGMIVFSLIAGFIISFIAVGTMKGKLKTVRTQTAAHNYVVNDSLNIYDSNDTYLYSTVSKVRRETERSSGSHGGGSSFHSSSSGVSHGGHGGKF